MGGGEKRKGKKGEKEGGRGEEGKQKEEGGRNEKGKQECTLVDTAPLTLNQNTQSVSFQCDQWKLLCSRHGFHASCNKEGKSWNQTLNQLEDTTEGYLV